MTKSKRIEAIVKWGKSLAAYPEKEELFYSAQARNQWFTPENSAHALSAITEMLQPQALANWLQDLPEKSPQVSRSVGIVMAGNIPIVGFHDLLCVLASGHQALVKCASKDEILVKWLAARLADIDSNLARAIHIVERLEKFDAVIATGSDNSARYFEYYFGKYPNIIRKNRTSVAVLNGDESTEQLLLLGEDVFRYFGLGCRNVSHIFIPADYDPASILSALEPFSKVMDHNKYKNNYDYNRTLLLLNGVKHLASDFLMMVEDDNIFSRLAVVHYSRYKDLADLERRVQAHESQIQCVVGKGNIPFGRAQHPSLDDYADGVNTIDFLQSL